MAILRTPRPASRSTAARSRTPPPASTEMPGTAQIARIAASFAARAASSSSSVAERSTTWTQAAPASRKDSATATGSSE